MGLEVTSNTKKAEDKDPDHTTQPCGSWGYITVKLSVGGHSLPFSWTDMTEDQIDIEAEIERIDNNIQGLFAKLGQVKELQEENEELKERVAELERVIDPDPGSKDYQSMSRAEKVRKLRASLYRKAESKGGKAQITYDEVLALFDHHPSAAHAYQLMERAAYAEGFRYDKMGPNNDGQKRLAVEIQSVKDEENFYTKNKTEQSLASA